MNNRDHLVGRPTRLEVVAQFSFSARAGRPKWRPLETPLLAGGGCSTTLIDMYFFEFWAIQLRITGPKEIQSPERLYKYATIVGNRFSFQYDILSYAQNL